MPPEAAPRLPRQYGAGSALRGLALAATLLAIAVLAGALWFRVGWWRMESACSLSGAGGEQHSSVSHAWTWHPLGFTCTDDDGRSETSLWP